MKNIKIKYILEHCITGETKSIILPIEEIENGSKKNELWRNIEAGFSIIKDRLLYIGDKEIGENFFKKYKAK